MTAIHPRASVICCLIATLPLTAAIGCDDDSGGGGGPSLPSAAVDSGFAMGDDAFSFPNFGGRSQYSQLTVKELVRLFGQQAVCDGAGGDSCLPTPLADTWMRQVNQAMKGGRCEGFAVLAQLLYLGEIDPSAFGGATASAVRIDDNEAVQREIAYWFATQSLGELMTRVTQQLDAREATALLGDALSPPVEELWRLGMLFMGPDGTPGGGHAITPYAVKPDPAQEGVFHIGVYDNNHPGEERSVRIDANVNSWSYVAAPNPNEPGSLYEGGPENGNKLYLSATRPRLGVQPCPFCKDGGGGGGPVVGALLNWSVRVQGEALGLVEDPGGGGRIGYEGPKLVQSLEGATLTRAFTTKDPPQPAWLDTSPRIFGLPAELDGFSLRLAGRSGEDQETAVAIVRPGVIIDVTGARVPDGQADSLTVEEGGQSLAYESAGGDAPALTVGLERDDGSQVVVEVDFSTEGGASTVEIRLSADGGQAEVRLAGGAGSGEPVSFRVRVVRSDGAGGRESTTAVAEAGAGSTMTLRLQEWDGQAALRVDVDDDGDGTPDRTRDLEDCTGELACERFGDRDGDGVPDGDDNCPDVDNPRQRDLDGDGAGDVCDDDDDGDGVADRADVCPRVADPGQEDADGDGVGDACADVPDSDGDGVPDDRDLCPLVPDPEQSDLDGDEEGDACDDDVDGDDLFDWEDPCLRDPDPTCSGGGDEGGDEGGVEGEGGGDEGGDDEGGGDEGGEDEGGEDEGGGDEGGGDEGGGDDGGGQEGEGEVEPMPEAGAPGPNPLGEGARRPATLRVRVVDLDDQPIEGASVRVAGGGGVTDMRGDARIDDVYLAAAPLVVSAAGHTQQTWRMDVSEGVLHRAVVRLAPTSAPGLFVAEDGAEITDGDVTLVVPAAALQSLVGRAHAGEVQGRLTHLRRGEGGGFPARLEGVAVGGGRVIVEPLGAFEASLEDGAGRPLLLGNDAEVEARLRVPDNAGLEDGDEVGVWFLDSETGLWLEEAGVTGVVGDDGEGLEVVAALPHLSTWAFGVGGPAFACLDVDVDLGGWPASRFSVELQGDDDFRLRARLAAGGVGGERLLRLSGLPGQAHTVRLYFEDARVAETQATPGRAGALGACDEANGVPSASLAIGAEQIVDLGVGPATAAVHLAAPPCAAADVDVVVTAPDGAEALRRRVSAPVLLLSGLTAGEWTVEAEGALEEGLIEVPAGCDAAGACARQEVVLTLPERLAWVPPGGCGSAPCAGPSCNSCVRLWVVDGVEAQSDVAVTLHEPIGASFRTEEDGAVCVPLPGLADERVLVSALGAAPATVALPRGARCGGPIACASATLAVGVDEGELQCPNTHVPRTGLARWQGLLHPGYIDDDVFEPPYPAGSSSVRVTTAAGDNRLTDALGVNWEGEELEDSAFAFQAMRSNSLGLDEYEATVLRIRHSEELGLSVRWVADERLTSADGAPADEVGLHVRAWWQGEGAPWLYEAEAGGFMRIDQAAAGRMRLAFEVSLSPAPGSPAPAGRIELLGEAWVPVLSPATTPQRLGNQLSHPFNGARWRIVGPGQPGGQAWGPSGLPASDPDDPRGEMRYCVPWQTRYMLVGEPHGRQTLRPFSPLYEFRGGRFELVGNDSPLGRYYVSFNGRWWDRGFVERVFVANGWGDDLATTGTIYGVAFTVDGAGAQTGYLEDFSEVWADRGAPGQGDYERHDGFKIRGDDLVADADARSSLFMISGLPPASMDNPFTLHLLDAGGQEVPGYSQRFAPIAGGIMIPHN